MAPVGFLFSRPQRHREGGAGRGPFRKLRRCCVILGGLCPSLSLFFLVCSLSTWSWVWLCPSPLSPHTVLPPSAGPATWLCLSVPRQCLVHRQYSAELGEGGSECTVAQTPGAFLLPGLCLRDSLPDAPAPVVSACGPPSRL